MSTAWRRRVAIAAGFAVATVVMAAPWSLHPASRVLVDDADAYLTMWTLGWDTHAFATAPWRIFDANIFHPNPNTLAYSENFIGSAIVVAPVVWATGNLVLAMNVAALIACAACGLGAYALARRLELSTWAAIVAGVVFAFSPARFFRMSQLHINAVQWVPLGLAFLHAYLEKGRPRDARLALGCLSAQALTSGHGAAFASVAYVALTAYSLARGAPLALLRRCRDIGVSGLVILAPVGWLGWHYLQAQRDVGLRRSLENWAVTPESFIASPSHVDRFLMSLAAGRPVNDTASAFLFPGLLVLLLAGVALWPRRGDSPGMPGRHVAFYALLAGGSALLFVSGPLSLWPWVYSWPGFNFVRVPSRFMVLTLLALAMLAGAGFERLSVGWPRSRRTFAGALVSLLLLGEFTAYPFLGSDYTLQIPDADRWLATEPAPFVVAEFPVPDVGNAGRFERYQTSAMLHSTAHWQPTIAGYSGIRPQRHEQAFRVLQHFPDEPSLAVLRELGVTHVVVHVDRYDRADWPAIADRLASTPELQLRHEAKDGRVYQVAAAR